MALATLGIVLTGVLGASSSGPARAQLAPTDVIWDGRLSPAAAAVSPDGHNVYVAGWEDDALTVFERDPATGELQLVEAHYDGIDGVEGLNKALSVAVSPEGGHVYVGGYEDHAVAVFARDVATGALSFTQAVVQGVGGVSGLNFPWELAVSPDGGHVYAAAFGVVILSRDSLTGELTFVGAESDLGPFEALALDPDGTHLYATFPYNFSGQSGVALFARDPTTGELTLLETYLSGAFPGIDGASSVAVSPDGRSVIVSGREEFAVAVFLADELTGALTFLEAHFHGVDGVGGLVLPSAVRMSPDGRNAYVKGLVGGQTIEPSIAIFARDPVNSHLTFVEVETQEIRGAQGGPGALAASPDGDHLYVASAPGDHSDLLTVLSREPATGALEFVQSVTGPGEALGLDAPESIGVSPDGRHVYAVGYFDSALVALRRDTRTGDLTFVEAEKDGTSCSGCLTSPVAVTLSPDGSHVYVSANHAGALSIFGRDATSGSLEFVEVQELPGPLIQPGPQALSPDGRFLYVTFLDGSTLEHGVAVFSRDETTGSLTFLEVVLDDADGVDGLRFVHTMTVSPDGANLYAASFADDAISVFSRDPSTGALRFLEAHYDGVRGVDGLGGAWGVAVSEDGANVYATAITDDALAVFQRDPLSGRLVFVEALFDGVSGVDGLDSARNVAVSADGLRVYATAAGDDALTVFRRAPATGRLNLLAAYFDGVGGLDGLGGADPIALTEDGKHLLVGGRFDDALVAFVRLEPVFADGFESGDTARWSGSVP